MLPFWDRIRLEAFHELMEAALPHFSPPPTVVLRPGVDVTFNTGVRWLRQRGLVKNEAVLLAQQEALFAREEHFESHLELLQLSEVSEHI